MDELTVGQLMDELRELPRDTRITFGSNVLGIPLTFYRFKMRGEDLLQIELNEQFELEGTYTITYDGGSYELAGPNFDAMSRR